MERWRMLVKKPFQDNQILYQTRSEQDQQELEIKSHE